MLLDLETVQNAFPAVALGTLFLLMGRFKRLITGEDTGRTKTAKSVETITNSLPTIQQRNK